MKKHITWREKYEIIK